MEQPLRYVIEIPDTPAMYIHFANYTLARKIGKGGGSVVYKCSNNSGVEYAMKVQAIQTPLLYSLGLLTKDDVLGFDKGYILTSQQLLEIEPKLKEYQFLKYTINDNKVVVDEPIMYDDPNIEYVWYLQFMSEIEFMTKTKIGPVLRDWWIRDGVGCIVMDIWDMSLERYLNLYYYNNPIIDLTPIKTQIEKIHSMGYVHMDICPKNILVNVRDGLIVDITLTDFGTVEKYPANLKLKKWVKYHNINRRYVLKCGDTDKYRHALKIADLKDLREIDYYGFTTVCIACEK